MTVVDTSTDDVLVGLGPDAERSRRRFSVGDRVASNAVLVLLVLLQVTWIAALLVTAYLFIFS